MPSFQINEAEWSLLAEEPAEVFKLYCVVRRVMDFATGIAGERRRINEQMLREALYVAPIRGRHDSGTPTRQKVRSLVERLLTLGALVQVGPLVFQLPHADRSGAPKSSATDEQPEQQPHLQPERQPINNQAEPSNQAGLSVVGERSATRSATTSGSTGAAINNLPPVTGKSKSRSDNPLPPVGETGEGYGPDFERFWSAYPRRMGGNSKKAAFKCWSARLREGVTPDDLVRAAGCYAAVCAATGKTGTAFVKQASTFLGPDEHWRDALKLQGPGSAWPRNTTQANKHGDFHERDYQAGIGAGGRF